MIDFIYIKNIQNINGRGIKLNFNASQNVILGINASGKTNILKSLVLLKQIILHQRLLKLSPYRFSENNRISELRIGLKINNMYYKYQIKFYFDLNNVLIEEEKFFKSNNGKTFVPILARDKDILYYGSNSFDIERGISSIKFLSLFQKDDDLEQFYAFMEHNVSSIHLEEIEINELLIEASQTKEMTNVFTILSEKLKELQIGIQSIDVTPMRYGKRDIALYHTDLEQLLSIDLESTGTKQLILILYHMFVLKTKVLIIDEAENNIHPSIIKKLLIIFLNLNSQLIFTTHSRELIDIEIASKWMNKKVFFIQKSSKGYVENFDLEEEKIILDIKDNIYRGYYLELFTHYTDKISTV